MIGPRFHRRSVLWAKRELDLVTSSGHEAAGRSEACHPVVAYWIQRDELSIHYISMDTSMVQYRDLFGDVVTHKLVRLRPAVSAASSC
jgi:hypothetical protein